MTNSFNFDGEQPLLTMAQRAVLPLSTDLYQSADPRALNVVLPPSFDAFKNAPSAQYVLRMMIKNPESNGFLIPDELLWLTPLIDQARLHHESNFPTHAYCYVTTRIGPVSSLTDDVWHVDGFSMRTAHLPQQSYLFADSWPAQVLEQVIPVPSDFDAFKHNLHLLFQERAQERSIRTLEPNKMYCIDPYVIHRRDPRCSGINRKMVRISFIPVEIEDDTCQQNPLMPEKRYNRQDIRTRLVRYEG